MKKVNKQPLVYIILVNYNGYQDTLECVKSILESTYQNIDIIIVDNNSNDKCALKNDLFLNMHSTIIYAPINGGFSYGNNIGINLALKNNADYIYLLNNDTTVDRNSIARLVTAAEDEQDAGIITGMVRYFDNPELINYFHGSYDKDFGIIKMVNTAITPVTFVCGCMMFLRKDMVKSIGLLDEAYFMYSEDLEYSCRAILNGWKLISADDAIIYHKISAAAKGDSDFQRYYCVRNNYKVLAKYSKHKTLGFIRMTLSSLKRAFVLKQSYKPIIQGIRDFFRGAEGRSSEY